MKWLLVAMAFINVLSIWAMFHPRPIHRGQGAVVAILSFSLLATELAWIWLVLQLALVALCSYFGALESGTGTLSAVIIVLTWPILVWRHWQGLHAGEVMEGALHEALGDDYRDTVPEEVRRQFRGDVRFVDWVNPMGFKRPSVELISDIPYLPGGVRQHLDIYRPTVRPANGCPVLLQIHGGGWMMGHKAQQARALLYHMAANGWICVAANYRLSPSVGFPLHLEDCKAALCWIREQGREYGMNPDFVAVTGGSAGGHLTALMGLTANRPDLQKQHPETDTTVQACVPLYGEYDFLTAHSQHPDYSDIEQYYIDSIMHASKSENPALWELASPITQVHEDAPPFLVVHGELDSLLPVAKAREFAGALKKASAAPVVYAELPGTEHGYETLCTPRAAHTVDAVHRFLEWVRVQA